MLKHMRNNLGYTLVEITVTTAIIGSLTAVAVPNFLRVKMNVNMELVKQHLKVIGQEMNELYNQANPHEFPADILTLDPAEELAITASLNGIDNKGYTLDGYLRGGSSGNSTSTYSFRTCPKEGLFNIAGDRCFLLDPMGIRELMPWDGDGVAMVRLLDYDSYTSDFSVLFPMILEDPALSEANKVEILAGLLEYFSYLSQTWKVIDSQFDNDPRLATTTYPILKENQGAFDALFPKAAELLEENGTHLYYSLNRNTEFTPYYDSVGKNEISIASQIRDPYRDPLAGEVVGYWSQFSERREASPRIAAFENYVTFQDYFLSNNELPIPDDGPGSGSDPGGERRKNPGGNGNEDRPR